MKFTLSYDPWREQPFFVPRNAEQAKPLPEFTHLRTTVPGRSRTVHDALVAMIDSASKRVFVCSFLLGGEVVRDALRRAVQRLRGHVYVITALDDRALQRSLAQELDEIDRDALTRERKSFEALTRHGVYVRGAENCHAKFCIVDDRVALVGSANFDPNGLDLDERGAIPCGELGLILERPERVSPLAALFRHLWKCGCQREAPPLREGYRLNGVSPGKEPAPKVPEEADTVVWTGFKSTAILAGIQSVIASAHHTLLLASYSFTGMREKPTLLLNALADARKRGVQVEMLLRDRSRDLPEIAALLDIGVKVRANRENHAKYTIADGDYGLIFSANFDGVHGLTDGVETGVRLRRDEAIEVAKWHAQMWRETPSQALCWPTSKAFAQAVPSIRHERPAFLGKKLSITGNADALSRCAAILKGPCLLVGYGDGATPLPVQLVGFDDVVRLEPVGTAMEASGLERDERTFCALPRLIATSKRRASLAWLPLGLEVSLQ
jgi:phosphatidylserine/phosphatidylglycerophosphate/cardiolipin synthase-like enzyme